MHYPAAVARRLSLLCLTLVLALAWTAAAGAWTRTELALPMDDGVSLAATLWEQPGPGPHPAIVLLHGLGGTRASTNLHAENVFAPAGYTVLTFDARAHGASGGLFGADGPREIQDVRNVVAWLAARPGVDAARIGGMGTSYGGGALWRSAAEGVPFAALVPTITWTDLFPALAPGGLSKSGAVFQFLQSVPAERYAPETAAIRAPALESTDRALVQGFADARSSRPLLSRLATPTLILHSRRDFAFDIEQAAAAFRLLAGPKRLYLGNLGHAPAANPAAEQPHYLGLARQWFDRFLRGLPNGVDAGGRVELARDPWNGRTARYAGLPPTQTVKLTLKGRGTIGAAGKTVLTGALPKRRLETFGAPVVKVTATTPSRWKQVVVVLSAIAPNGRETVVSQGGALTPQLGRAPRTVTLRLISQATPIAAGSKLRVTVAATSLAQNPGNLLYLTGVPTGSRLSVKSVQVSLPVLRTPVSR